ncbi:MAG: fibronectin type III domain-containing protein [Spirochaetales bacterium]|nr:fibronectin type III domain-containing protein [Spirochaetales bacterium]
MKKCTLLLMLSLVLSFLFLTCTVPFVDDGISPAVVADVTVSQSGNQVILTWTDPSDSDLEHIKIKCTPGGYFQRISSATERVVFTDLEPETIYTFTLTASDIFGNLAPVVTVTHTVPAVIPLVDNTAPGEVTGQSFIPFSSTVNITWSDPADTDYHHTAITYTPGGTTPIEIPGGIEFIQLPFLTNGVEYTFNLKTVDQAGNISTGVTGTAIPQEALGVLNVNGADAVENDGEVILSWTDPVQPNLSHIEVSWLPGGATAQVVTLGLETFTAAPLLNDTRYTFTLRAVDINGGKSSGLQVSAVPRLGPDLTPPDDITITGAAEGDAQVDFTWLDPSDIDLEYILISVVPNGNGVIRVPAGEEAYLVKGLTNGVSHTITFKTEDSSGNVSDPGIVNSYTPTDSVAPPSEVAGLFGVSSDKQITLNWSDPPEADFAYVIITYTPGFTGNLVVPAGVETSTISNLTNNVAYTFIVRTQNLSGSISSGESLIKTPTVVPDTTSPVINSITHTPNPTVENTTVTILVDANDPESGVTGITYDDHADGTGDWDDDSEVITTSAGTYDIDVRVTSEGGTTEQAYTVTVVSANSYAGDLIITDNAELAAAASYTEITGNLTINDSGSVITNIDALENLITITGNLTITSNPLLTNTDGLRNLNSVDSITVSQNSLLTSIDFTGITDTSLVNIDLNNNPLCTSVAFSSLIEELTGYLQIYTQGNSGTGITMTGFENLTQLLRIGIWDSKIDAINLDSLETMTQGSTSNNINNIEGLTSLIFTNLYSINSPLSIYDCSDLQVVSLPGFTSLTKGLYVYNNPVLTTFSMPELLSSNPGVGVAISIQNNDSLTTFDLSKLQICDGNSSLSIQDNDNLISLPDLGALQSVQGTLTIDGNALTNLSGFDLLTYAGTITISDNYDLTSVALGVSSGGITVGTLNVTNNDNLENLTGLTGVTGVNSITGSLSITNNSALTSVNGLENITIIGGSLTVTGNNILSDLSGFSGLTSISSNLTISGGLISNLSGFSALEQVLGIFNIYTCSTITRISTVDMPNLARLYSLDLSSNAILNEINLSGLTYTWMQNISLSNLSLLDTFNLGSNVTDINGYLALYNVESLENLSGLSNIDTIVQYFNVGNCDRLSEVSLPALGSIGPYGSGTEITFYDNTDLANISLPGWNMTTGGFTIYNNPSLSTVDLSGLVTITEGSSIYTNGLSAANMTIDLSGLTSANMPVSHGLYIYNNGSLSSVDLSTLAALTGTSNHLIFYDNPIVTLDISAIDSITGNFQIDDTLLDEAGGPGYGLTLIDTDTNLTVGGTFQMHDNTLMSQDDIDMWYQTGSRNIPTQSFSGNEIPAAP